MSAEPRFDARHSPSVSSQYSVTSNNFYYPSTSALNNVEPHAQRQSSYPVTRSVSVPYPQQPYHSSQYYPSPQSSISSYYSPSSMQVTPPQAQISGLCYQRPLPQVSFLFSCISQPFLIIVEFSATYPTYHYHGFAH